MSAVVAIEILACVFIFIAGCVGFELGRGYERERRRRSRQRGRQGCGDV